MPFLPANTLSDGGPHAGEVITLTPRCLADWRWLVRTHPMLWCIA